MQYILVVMLFLTVLDLGTAQATSPIERESLRGLPGVVIVIEELARDAEAAGLSQYGIRATVEHILRSSGIRILKFSKGENPPWLYVRLATYQSRSGGYAVAPIIRLNQRVPLRADYKMDVITWETASIGYCSANNLKATTRAIEELTKEFANDFLTVNPVTRGQIVSDRTLWEQPTTRIRNTR